MFDPADMVFAIPDDDLTYYSPLPETADCLSCGLCLHTCPTFTLFASQEETPRSRVRTLRKILFDKQSISATEREHLDNCLQCRACETVCPSKRSYAAQFDQAQAQLAQPPSLFAKLALTLIAHKTWRSRLMPSLAFYLRSGLQQPIRRSGLLKKLGLAEAEALLTNPVLKPLATHYPSTRRKLGQVALFTGCITEHFDRASLHAAIQLLNAIGYDVIIPLSQGCCGAIHQHNGFNATALIKNNIAIFNALNVDAVVFTTTGCGAMLSEYEIEDTSAADKFKQRLQDILDFLLEHWPDDFTLKPLAEKIAIHEPCSQRNVLKNQQTVYALLAKIPALEVIPLADNALCCGAAGTYQLTHPENAQQLCKLKQQVIKTAGVTQVISSNYACAAFLNTEHNSVTHPLQILAQQL